ALSIVYFYSDRAHRTLLSFPTRRSSDLNTSPEASCAADRRRLTHVPGRMEERDAAQHRRAGSTGKRLHQSFSTRAECAFGRRTLHRPDGDIALPIVCPEAADDLARPQAHGIAVLAERGDVDLFREVRD